MHKIPGAHRLAGILCTLILFASSGCANQSLQLGVDAYNQGNYDLAESYWNPLAKEGDPHAQYNLGLLWEKGLGSTPKNETVAARWYALSAKQGYILAMVRLGRIQKELGYENAATSWFNLAARWGNKDAIVELQNWGKPIPPADLLAAQQYRDAIAREKAGRATEDAAYELGRALGGGGGRASSYTPSPSSYSTTPNGSSCTSDFSCGIGYKCVKAPLSSIGVCMESVDEQGLKQYNLPSGDSVGPNLNLQGQCNFDSDCPVGFRCDRTYKACVKR
jgi:hypothetical protein